MGWEDFKLQIGAILGSDAAQAQKKCQLQCSLDNKYDFCCEAKKIDKKDFFCYEFADIGCDVQCKEIVCQL